MTTAERLKERVRPYYLRWFYFRFFPHSRPASFEQCWQHPWWPLSDMPQLPSRSGLDDVLFYPMNDWHGRLQRTQHLARELAALGHRCIYLNPHLGRQFPEVGLHQGGHRISRLEERVFELHVRLPSEPVFHQRLLTPAESGILSSTAERLFSDGETPRVVQILSLPVWLEAALQLREKYGAPIVYDCHDLLSGFPNMSPAIVAQEARLFREADVVCFSAANLLERFAAASGELRAKSVIIPNGVDPEHFPMNAPSHRPSQAQVAGYVGAIEHWFDVAAVQAAAESNPECRFVLIGRVENQAAHKLTRLKNVELAGEVAYADLPARLAQFDIGLIPFRRLPLTESTNPIKLYEYFSCGLPVVSAPLPEVEALGDLVALAATPEEFAIQVRLALRDQDPARRERRRRIALQASWAARAGALIREINRATRGSSRESKGAPKE